MSEDHYYELLVDPEAKSRWYLKSPLDPNGNELDPRIFTQGLMVMEQPDLRLPIRREGHQIDFNLCDFDMVVTPKRFNEELEMIAGEEIQRIPVNVEKQNTEYEILNVCRLVRCVDETRSLITKWADEDGRPDKVGQYRMIVKLFIDPAAAKGHQIFRVSGWPIALIASEKVKRLFEKKEISGVKFERVT